MISHRTNGENSCYNYAQQKSEAQTDVPCAFVPLDPWKGKSRAELWQAVVKLMPDNLVLQTYRDILKQDVLAALKPAADKGDMNAIRKQLMEQNSLRVDFTKL